MAGDACDTCDVWDGQPVTQAGEGHCPPLRAGAQPRWYGSNLVGVPALELASTGFNAQPVPLSIKGIRAVHPALFAQLETAPTLLAARERFVHYMDDAFALHKPPHPAASAAVPPDQRRWRTSWRKLLQGWGMDANGPAGAVIKGWVESRFGLTPTFHKAPLGHYPSDAWVAYIEEKNASRYHNNHIHQQFDVLYEFCQLSLRRFGPPASGPTPQHTRLWRGSNRCEEQLVAGRLTNRRCTMQLNNIVSMSLCAQDASCFGDWVLQVHVPLCKLLVYPGLLPGQVLQGEQEVLALGGLYEVEASDVVF